MLVYWLILPCIYMIILVGSGIAASDCYYEYEMDKVVLNDVKLFPSKHLSDQTTDSISPTRDMLDKTGKKSIEGHTLNINDLLLHSVKNQHERTNQPIYQKVKAQGYNYGRGVGYVTTTDIKKGELLISIPFASIMDQNSAAQGRIGLLMKANPTLPVPIVLALHVLEETFLGSASRYSSFINTLPTKHGINSTLYFSSDELDLLKGSQILRLTESRRNAIRHFYNVLITPVTSLALDPPLFRRDEFTYENFQWALSIVWSHAFQIGAREDDVVLAPILDRIGICVASVCAKLSNNIIINQSARELQIFATTTLLQGEQVLLHMPNKSSAFLLLNHGFTRPMAIPNVDKLDISIAIDSTDPLLEIKMFLLENVFNTTMNARYELFYGRDTLSATMINSLKVKLFSSSDLEQIQKLKHFNPLKSSDQEVYAHKVEEAMGIVSLRNEFAFLRSILNTCQQILNQYSTTLEEDMAKLSNYFQNVHRRLPPSTDRYVHILSILMIEKEILHQTINIVKSRWMLLLESTDPNLSK